MNDSTRSPAKPTKSGFYWLFQADHNPQIVEVVIDGEERVVYMPGSDVPFHLDDTSIIDESECEWAGPLEPPA